MFEQRNHLRIETMALDSVFSIKRGGGIKHYFIRPLILPSIIHPTKVDECNSKPTITEVIRALFSNDCSRLGEP